MKKEIGIIGLGKMGGGIALQLKGKGWDVVGYDANAAPLDALAKEGIRAADSPQALVGMLSHPRLVWLMVPAGKAIDDVLFGAGGIAEHLLKGDVVIDGGNSFYKDDLPRAEKLASRGVTYFDVGFSGGPKGARHGGCLMIGGDENTFKSFEPLFADLSVEGGYQFFSGAGAGHFVKMVHNGIEYGMMQALAEGFGILKASDYKIDLTRAADIYNHRSVIESRLVGWLKSAFEQYGEDLEAVSGSVGHTGEGEWTAKTAHELNVPATIIEESFKFRVESAQKPSYIGKVVSALRNQFGGHSIGK